MGATVLTGHVAEEEPRAELRRMNYGSTGTSLDDDRGVFGVYVRDSDDTFAAA